MTSTPTHTYILPDVPEWDRKVLCRVVGCLYVEEQSLEGVGEAQLELHGSNQDKTNSHSITQNWKTVHSRMLTTIHVIKYIHNYIMYVYMCMASLLRPRPHSQKASIADQERAVYCICTLHTKQLEELTEKEHGKVVLSVAVSAVSPQHTHAGTIDAFATQCT